MLHYASQFCNELKKRDDRDVKVAIASYHDGSIYDPDTEFIQIRTQPSALSFIIDSLNIFYHIYFLLKIFYFKPDIVHFMDNHPWYIVYGRIFKIFWYTIYVTQHDPVLHSGEDSTILGKISIEVNRVLRNLSDKLMVHGDMLKKQVIDNYNFPQEKVFSIRHGSYSFFNTWAQWIPVQKDTFLFFGRIVDYKWLDTLLDSLEYVIQKIPDAKLIIAGPWDLSWYKKWLEKYRKNIEIYNHQIEPEEIYKYFEVSEFVVLPYKDATGSGVIPIAYGFSKAVIVTDVWALSSVVSDGETGILVEPSNPDILGEKIVELLTKKDTVRQMWIAGKTFCDDHLSWKDIIDTIYPHEEK